LRDKPAGLRFLVSRANPTIRRYTRCEKAGPARSYRQNCWRGACCCLSACSACLNHVWARAIRHLRSSTDACSAILTAAHAWPRSVSAALIAGLPFSLSVLIHARTGRFAPIGRISFSISPGSRCPGERYTWSGFRCSGGFSFESSSSRCSARLSHIRAMERKARRSSS
jgi:hypothetical protein